jgi:hypothetical protein
MKTAALIGSIIEGACSRTAPQNPQEARAAKRSKLKASLGKPIRYPVAGGDVWTTTWADDDNLYSVSDDTSGFGKACDSNLALSRISGDSPSTLHGVTVNSMSEFGKATESNKLDDASWKASGLTCVDSVLYLAVSRHGYANDGGYSYLLQQTWDASIIKSEDHGKTWKGIPKVGQAMFPGHLFSDPFFVQYGKNGQGSKDGADEYVYALSNDGIWNNGNWMTMGRVRRDQIANLNPHDWEFIQRFDKDRNPIWGPRYDTPRYVFRNPGRTSMTSIAYVSGLDLYLMPQWYYTHLDDAQHTMNATRLEFYYAPAPWGPWTLFHSQDSEPEGWYNPCIWSKFISDEGRKLWLSTSGLGPNFPTNSDAYCLTLVPVTVEELS